MPAQVLREGEQEARKLRRLLDLGDAKPVPDIVHAAEQAGVDCFLTRLPRPISGLAGRVNGRWYIVADSGVASGGRIRFTLAHELGHVFMGHEPSVDDEDTLHATGASLPLEVEANFFAAEFMLPRDAIFDRIQQRPFGDSPPDMVQWIEECARDHGVTSWVTLYRLRTLDLLRWKEEQTVKPLLSSARPVDSFQDTVAGLAGTGHTRMPLAYQRRAESPDAPDEGDQGDSPW